MSPESPGHPSSGGFLDSQKPGHHVPHSVVTIGMWLFLASLSMLFIASLIGYILVRHLNRARFGISLHLPALLWASSALVIGVSFTLSLTLSNLRRERQKSFRFWLKATVALAVGFILVQTPAMASLFMEHQRAKTHGVALYGLVFFLILLHALHVIGGLVALGIVTAKGLRGNYDHEHYSPVRHAAMYWHFLDVVWLVMFSTFLVVG